eukprot:s273_g3.t1
MRLATEATEKSSTSSPAQKGEVLKRLLGYAATTRAARRPVPRPKEAKPKKSAPVAPAKPVLLESPSARAVEALAAATEVALVCGQMLRQAGCLLDSFILSPTVEALYQL